MARYGTAYAALNQMTGLEYAAFLKDVEVLLESAPGRVTELLEAARALLHDKSGALDIYAGSGGAIRAHRANMERFWGISPPGNGLPPTGAASASRRPGRAWSWTPTSSTTWRGPGRRAAASTAAAATWCSPRSSPTGISSRPCETTWAYTAPISWWGRSARSSPPTGTPNVKATYDVYDALPRWAETEELTQAEMDGYILKTYSSAALPSGPLAEGVNAAKYAERGRGTEDRLRILQGRSRPPLRRT